MGRGVPGAAPRLAAAASRHIEISNQRAAELTAARAEIRHLQAAVTRFLQIIETIRRDHTFYHDDHGASIPLEPLYTHILATMNLMTQAEAFAAPGAIGALWVGPPTPDGVPTEQERNARMWLPRFAPPQQTPPPFAGQGHRLGE